MKNNRLFNALGGLDDSHFRAEELESLASVGSSGSKRRISRSIRIAMSAAAAAAVLGISITAGAAATNGFTSGFTSSFNSVGGYDTWRDQPTVNFSAASFEGAPETIEQTYAPALLKDGVNYRKSVYMHEGRTRYSLGYMPEIEDRLNKPFWSSDVMQLVQETKAEFRDWFYTPKYVDVKEITVNGYAGFVISCERYSGTLNVIVWDNGDYIFRLWCVMPEEEAIKIAESVAPCDEATGEVLA